MHQNTAVNLEPKSRLEEEDELEISVFSQAAQALSRPVSMPEYLADKLIGGLVTTITYIGVTKGIDKFKEARALKREQDSRVQ